jgi:hypothetical protein
MRQNQQTGENEPRNTPEMRRATEWLDRLGKNIGNALVFKNASVRRFYYCG